MNGHVLDKYILGGYNKVVMGIGTGKLLLIIYGRNLDKLMIRYNISKD